MAQMHGHSTALNGRIPMVMVSATTVQMVQQILTDSRTLLVLLRIMILMVILTDGLLFTTLPSMTITIMF